MRNDCGDLRRRRRSLTATTLFWAATTVAGAATSGWAQSAPDTVAWQGGSLGAWHDAANWQDNVVPTSSINATFDTTTSVTFGASAAAKDISINAGNTAFEMNVHE